MHLTGSSKTSYSRFSSWLRCPRLHKYRYIDQAAEERVSATMLLGTAFHEAAELLFRGLKQGEAPLTDEVFAAFDRALVDSIEFQQQAGCPVDFGKSTREELHNKGHEMLGTFLAEVPRDIHVLDVERAFEVELEPGRLIEGVLDLVLEQSGSVLVVDLKTSATAFGEDKLRFDLQPTVYLHGARGLYGMPADFEYWVVTRTKSPRLIRYPVVRDQSDHAELIEAVREVEAATALGVFPRRRDWQCQGCEYADRCAGERG